MSRKGPNTQEWRTLADQVLAPFTASLRFDATDSADDETARAVVLRYHLTAGDIRLELAGDDLTCHGLVPKRVARDLLA